MKFAFVFLLFTLAATEAPAFAKYTVCTATINSNEESHAFLSKLNPADFDFVELTKYNGTMQNTEDWLQNACGAKVTCDVLVVSGHFGGNFFGASNFHLNLKDLEKHSCKNTCSGILSHPKEVYLFGCNTLADKGKDTRTPEQYRQALVHDNVDAADAERIVAARYGPFGSSFKDQMERIFEGVPVIYGFSSIAPLGVHVKTSLENYLTRIGDFKTHLDHVHAGDPNPVWWSTMSAYNRAMGTGLSQGNAGYAVKVNSCALSDDDKRLSDRLSLAERLLSRDPLLYLPAVSSFVNTSVTKNMMPVQDRADYNQTNALLSNLRGRNDLHDLFDHNAHSEGVTPTIKVDLLNAEMNLGWMTEADLSQQLQNLFSKYTNKPDSSGADFICSQVEANRTNSAYIRQSDIYKYRFNTVAEFKIANCARVTDPNITTAALKGYWANRARFKGDDILYVLWSLDMLPGHSAEKAAIYRPLVNAKAFQNELHVGIVRALLKYTQGAEQDYYLKKSLALMSDRKDLWQVIDAVAMNPYKTDQSIETVLSQLWNTKGMEGATMSMHMSLIPDSVPLENWIAQNGNRLSDFQWSTVARGLVITGKVSSDALKDAMIERLRLLSTRKGEYQNLPAEGLDMFAFILAQSQLSDSQFQKVVEIFNGALNENLPFLRSILIFQDHGRVQDRSLLVGRYSLIKATVNAYNESNWTTEEHQNNP